MSAIAGWTLQLPVRVHAGRGSRGALADAPGGSWLVVTSRRGRDQLLADDVLGPLVAERAAHWVDDVAPNPDASWLEVRAAALRGGRARVDAVLGFGGGSAIDAAKVLAALVAAPEDVGLRGLLADAGALSTASVPPLWAVATTAGTGSEVTPFATVWDHAARRKHSLASPAVWPVAAIVDADLMDALPPDATLATGLDAINQAAESAWNRRANPVTLELAARALEVGMPALARVVEDGTDRAAREGLAEASLLAGLAISHTRTALCHAMSYPITAHHGVAHGLACAFTMAAVARHVVPGDDGRLARLARRLWGPGARAADLVERFGEMLTRLGVTARVRAAVGSRAALVALAPEMATPGRADNALVPAAPADLERIAGEAWDGWPC